MKKTALKTQNIYSCQFCHGDFRSSQDFKIILDLFPLCSNLCRFKLYFRILSTHTDKTLKQMAFLLQTKLCCIKSGEKQEISRNELINRLTKAYITRKKSSGQEITGQELGLKRSKQVKVRPTHTPVRCVLTCLALTQSLGGLL